MKKRLLITLSIVIIMTISILLLITSVEVLKSNDETIQNGDLFSEKELRRYSDLLVDIAQKNDKLDWIGCGVQKNANGYYVNLELRQYDGVDYDVLKEIIYKEIGVEFPLQFELVPMPETPSIEGIVRNIVKASGNYNNEIGTILVISDTKFIGRYKTPDALDITITDQTIIEDKDGNQIKFDLIKLGTRVESYYRGMTLDTYPGIQGSEKLIVDLDYQTKHIKDMVDLDLYKYKFKGINVSEPYYFAFGYDQSIRDVGPYDQIWLHMEEGLEYYDLDTLEPVYHEGEIIIYIRSNNEEILEEPYVLKNTMVPKSFVPIIKDVDLDGYYEFFIPYYEYNQWIDRCFKILENEVIRDSVNDRNRIDLKDGTYIMQTTDESGAFLPRVTINGDKITFSYDFLSSYASIGTYSIDGNVLTMITNDEMYKYKFQIDKESLYFIEDQSSKIKLTDEKIGYEILDNMEFRLGEE